MHSSNTFPRELKPSMLFCFSISLSITNISTNIHLFWITKADNLETCLRLVDWCSLLASRTRILVMTATIALSIIKKVKRQAK